MAQAVEIGQLDYLRFLMSEQVDCPPNLPCLPHALERRREGDDLGIIEAVGSMSTFPSIGIHRGPASDRVQPGAGLASNLEGSSRPPRLEEGLLGGLFGQRSVPQRPVTDSEHRAPVLTIERIEGVGITSCQTSHDPDRIHLWFTLPGLFVVHGQILRASTKLPKKSVIAPPKLRKAHQKPRKSRTKQMTVTTARQR